MTDNRTRFTFTIGEEKPKPQRTGKQKLNLARLARSTGFSKSHLSRVFRGKCNPSVRCLRACAAILNTTMDEVLTGIENGRYRVEDN